MLRFGASESSCRRPCKRAGEMGGMADSKSAPTTSQSYLTHSPGEPSPSQLDTIPTTCSASSAQKTNSWAHQIGAPLEDLATNSTRLPYAFWLPLSPALQLCVRIGVGCAEVGFQTQRYPSRCRWFSRRHMDE
ncbi:hypothetical protein BOTBODRAFT_348662 [Botryobasidium botryosum FD-172 SS1]|uniref:Uncharacterized protein n=1 Tax=Botryobasidium botryosum (strain FD-172 SS1) TaxID=930990 RepID=A0A067MR65_BOTB1|nr:hypothetical protein BOTBODRAFT_348662 [Botryobasidium botryosum FD-172 SS1]